MSSYTDQRGEIAISVVTVINYPSSPRLGERRLGGEGHVLIQQEQRTVALICPEYAPTTMTAFRDQPKRSACPCFLNCRLGQM